jgi:hypothetical protein
MRAAIRKPTAILALAEAAEIRPKLHRTYRARCRDLSDPKPDLAGRFRVHADGLSVGPFATARSTRRLSFHLPPAHATGHRGVTCDACAQYACQPTTVQGVRSLGPPRAPSAGTTVPECYRASPQPSTRIRSQPNAHVVTFNRPVLRRVDFSAN